MVDNVRFEKRQTLVECIAIEYAGKGFCDDERYAERRDGNRCVFSARAAAEIFALAAALILRLAFLTGFVEDAFPLTFAHRAFCAAAILALPAALIFRLLFGSASAAGLDGEPKSLPIRFCSDSILSFRLAA